MNEPVKVKYVPFDEVVEIIKKHCWITDDLYQMLERRGIDVVEYKCLVTVSDQDASMFNGYTNFTVEEYSKKRASEWLSECVDRHIKCVDKERCPMSRATEYRYGIMIGEIPKWKQKGEKDAEELPEFIKEKPVLHRPYYMTREDAKKVLKINEEQEDDKRTDVCDQ